MTTAPDVARYLIRLAALEEGGEPMTAMRLHKLLYYCQGWHLAWYGEPLFPEAIEAWRHGPMVPAVSNRLPDSGGAGDLPPSARKSVEQVWRHFRQFSACGLRDRTRREAPWRNHYHDGNGEAGETIPVDEMAAYFGAEYTRLTGEEPGSEAALEANIANGKLISYAQAIKELGW